MFLVSWNPQYIHLEWSYRGDFIINFLGQRGHRTKYSDNTTSNSLGAVSSYPSLPTPLVSRPLSVHSSEAIIHHAPAKVSNMWAVRYLEHQLSIIRILRKIKNNVQFLSSPITRIIRNFETCVLRSVGHGPCCKSRCCRALPEEGGGCLPGGTDRGRKATGQ